QFQQSLEIETVENLLPVDRYGGSVVSFVIKDALEIEGLRWCSGPVCLCLSHVLYALRGSSILSYPTDAGTFSSTSANIMETMPFAKLIKFFAAALPSSDDIASFNASMSSKYISAIR